MFGGAVAPHSRTRSKPLFGGAYLNGFSQFLSSCRLNYWVVQSQQQSRAERNSALLRQWRYRHSRPLTTWLRRLSPRRNLPALSFALSRRLIGQCQPGPRSWCLCSITLRAQRLSGNAWSSPCGGSSCESTTPSNRAGSSHPCSNSGRYYRQAKAGAGFLLFCLPLFTCRRLDVHQIRVSP